jgi:hypothetical protein
MARSTTMQIRQTFELIDHSDLERNITFNMPKLKPYKNPKKGFCIEAWQDILSTEPKHKDVNQRRLRQSFQYEDMIPWEMRGEIWIYVLCGGRRRLERLKQKVKYSQLRREVNRENNSQIRKDLQRTVLEHAEFAIPPETGKNRLYNILNAYANIDSEVGYCQGMNFLAAMLLFNIIDEEDAFWCLVMIMMPRDPPHPPHKIRGLHNWRLVFVPTMEKTIEMQDLLEKTLEEKAPKAFKKI